MPEGTETPANGNGNEGNQPGKVEFSTEQQAAINKIFDGRFAKVNAKHEEEMKTLREENERLKAEATKKPKTGSGEGDGDAKEQQYKDLLTQEKNKTGNAEKIAGERQKKIDELASENLRIRKDVAIQNAAGTKFHALDVVQAMVGNKVEWDEETSTFVVRENGVIRQNNSLQNMTLDEYFEEMAQKYPYLAKSDLKSGTGGGESKGSNGMPTVKSKADLKTVKDKTEWVRKFGYDAYEKLPLK